MAAIEGRQASYALGAGDGAGRPLRLGSDSALAEGSGEFEAWRGVFDRVGVAAEVGSRMIRRAAANRTTVQAELIGSGVAGEAALCEGLAAELGVRFAPTLGRGDILSGEADCIAHLGHRPGAPALRVRGAGGDADVVVSTDGLQFARARAALDRDPALRARLVMVPRTVLRSALIARCSGALLERAVGQLFAGRPDLSARRTGTWQQGYVAGAITVLSPLAFVLYPELALLALHLSSSLFFFACVGVRFAALSAASPPDDPAPLRRFDAGELPTYSVLVALYKEAEVVPELLVALGSIVWPRSKIEIKLVCEADDRETLAALRTQPLKPWVEIVEVPACEPRTKPKALAYALPLVQGEFVVLYDAEDRPHPAQLLEAWQAFRDDTPELACLQAPLEISNRRHGFIPRMFGLEYAALFRGLLPFLDRWRLVIPLGGTSNHFRREALEAAGGWDPFNVTEDADLGVRFARLGYRIGTITRPTFEAAPESAGIWIRQRTRWFKGWCQTWIVHMRAPGALLREIDARSFLIVQILSAGLVLSAIVHPVMIVTGLWLGVELVCFGASLGIAKSIVLAVDLLAVVGGYVSFLLLGWCSIGERDRRGFWKMVVGTPAYWLMLSVSAWRAVWQLWRQPHRWEKTPHFRTRTGRA